MEDTEPTPESGIADERLYEIIDEYLKARQQDHAPARQELLARYPELAAELEEFLDNYENFGVLRDGGGESADSRAALTLRPGMRIGDYEVLEEIGRGGMGVVFKARQVTLRRTVALKLILAGRLASEREVQRFRREAEAAAVLDHPAIVSIYEIGEHDGLHYFSMPYVDGASLSRSAHRFVSDPRRTAALLETISRAVQYAHERGVLHRDLKPSNVLIDREGNPHVLDFGLAKILSNDGSLTVSGAVLGTPSYLAPEQTESGGHRDTPATDVYSLGAMLYELLTGRPPFSGKTSLEIIDHVRKRDPVRPRALNPRVPLDLQTICLTCLDKEPRRRYASADALADDLRRFVEGRVIRARRASAVERGWRVCRRNPVVSGSIAAVIAALALLAVGLLIANVRLRDTLWHAYLDQARALRSSGLVGQRLKSLAALRQATAIRPDKRLRSDAIASLGLPDLEHTGQLDVFPRGVVNRWWEGANRMPVAVDRKLIRFVCGEESGEVRVGRVKDGVIVLTLRDMKRSVKQVSLSHDGRFVSARDAGGRLCVWEVASPASPCVDTRRVAAPKPWNFHPTADEVAVGFRGGRIVIHALPDGARREILNASETAGRIQQVLYRPDGKAIAILGEEGRGLFLWNLKSGELRRLQRFPRRCQRVAWHPNGEVLVASVGRDIRLIDARHGLLWVTRADHRQAIMEIGFHPGSRFLLASSADNTLRVWNLESGLETLRLYNHVFTGFSPNGDRLVTTEVSGKLTLWDFHSPGAWRSLARIEPPGILKGVAVSRDSRLLVASTSRGCELFDFRSGLKLGDLPLKFTGSVFFDDQGRLFTWNGLGLLRWSFVFSEGLLRIGPPIRLVKGSNGRWGRAAAASDGETAAAVTRSTSPGELTLASPLLSGQPLKLAADRDLLAVAIAGDGRLVAAGGLGTGVRVWSLPGGEVVRDLPADQDLRIRFSPDGRHLIVGARTEYTYWEIRTWTVARTIEKDVHGHSAMALSPAANLLALGSSATTVKLVRADSGEKLADVETYAPVEELCFDPSGRYLVTCADRAIRVLDLSRLGTALDGLGLGWEGLPFSEFGVSDEASEAFSLEVDPGGFLRGSAKRVNKR